TDILVEKKQDGNLLYGTELERSSVERDEAGEGADCGRPRDQEYLERADLVERSSTHWIYANGSEKSSAPGELSAGMVERSSTHGIYANGSEKSSVPVELRADMVERSSTHGIYANGSEKSSVPGDSRADMVERSSTHGIYADRSGKSSNPLKMHRAILLFRPTTELSGKYNCKVSTYLDEDEDHRDMIVF
ncbi:hypothetical protein QYM36_015294, partial [Artemia franciscana]